MSPLTLRILMTVGAVGCFVLAATLLKGSPYELVVAGIAGQLFGWAHFEKPAEKAPKTLPDEASQ